MYHFGLKVGTTDEELRDALETLVNAGADVRGTADHGVTHSLYIADPDGNEIELYIDVQPEVWRDEPLAVMAPRGPSGYTRGAVSTGAVRGDGRVAAAPGGPSRQARFADHVPWSPVPSLAL